MRVAAGVLFAALAEAKSLSDLALAHWQYQHFFHHLRGPWNGPSLHFDHDLTLVSHSSSITPSIYRWESLLE